MISQWIYDSPRRLAIAMAVVGAILVLATGDSFGCDKAT